VRVWSKTKEHAERFARAHGAKALEAEAAVRGADVVVTATSTHTPVLKGEWLKPDSLVISVGAVQPTWRELDDDTVKSAALVVDSRAACLKETGDVILSKASIYAEAGEIFSGKVKPPSGRIVFKSVGLAVEDIATARLVYDKLTK
jgi:thiomorpholine-carboxylate dehydrogenase